MHCQTLVLGAGIVGVSTALHLQARGRQVILIDRDEPGSGTSDAAAPAQAADAAAPAPPVWARSNLLGDMGGLRGVLGGHVLTHRGCNTGRTPLAP